MKKVMFIVYLFSSLMSYGTVTVEFYNPPAHIRDGVRDSLTVRFKVSGMSGAGPWIVSNLRLYEDDVLSDDLIKSIYSPAVIYSQNTWYYYTFSDIIFSNYEPANDGLELYSKIYVGSDSDKTPTLYRTIEPNYAPTTPYSLSVTGKTDHEISLSWSTAVDPEGDIVKYRIEYGRDDILGDGWTYAGTTTDTHYTITGLSSDSPYIIRFTAKDEYGASGSSRDWGPITTYEFNPTYFPVVARVSPLSEEIKHRQRFQISADITDQTARADLEQVILYVWNKNKGTFHTSTLTLNSMYCTAPSDYFRVVDVQKVSIANGYRITWTLCSQEGLADVDDLIAFQVQVKDKEGNNSVIVNGTQDAVFKRMSLPENKWTIISHGKANDVGNGPGPWDWPSDMSSWFTNVSTPGGWMYGIADELRKQSQTEVKIHRVRHDSFEIETWNPSLSTYELSNNNFDTNAHHVLLFDWSNPSDFIDLLAGISHKQDSWYAYAAGDALYALLYKIGASNHISTLIGYSRGGIVSSEVSRRLLRAGAPPFQVIYLDAEGSNHYLDNEFHGWAGTRTDQYREVSSTSVWGGILEGVGANPLDEGNDRRLHDWPRGFDQSGRLDHGEWSEYFIESLYITEDPLIGTCLETPHFWKDYDGVHDQSDITYPDQLPSKPEVDSEGLYNPYFDQYSLAGWCYHGGGGQNRLGNSVDEDGKADLCSFAPYITHNWTKLDESLHYSFIKFYSSASGVPSSAELSLKWNGMNCCTIIPSSGYKTVPVDFDLGQVGRLKVQLTGINSNSHVDIDNFEFITTDVPTIGYLVFLKNPLPLGEDALLRANNLVDTDGVKTMEVYFDRNTNLVAEASELIASEPVGMSSSHSIGIYTGDFGVGNHQFLVRVADMNDVWSDLHSIIMIVEGPVGDKDADGLPDSWEYEFFASETNALAGFDADGDGYDNFSEYVLGTDPTNKDSNLLVSIEISNQKILGTNSFIINWNSVSNRVYRIMATTTLSNNFSKISGEISYPINSYTNHVDKAVVKKFYRVDVDFVPLVK